MKRILALDPATNLGWAANYPARCSGVENLKPNNHDSRGMLYIRYGHFLMQMIDLVEPDLIVFERGFRRGGAATEIAIGLMEKLKEICEIRKINFTDVPNTTVKKFAIGKGKADKMQMVLAAAERWPDQRIDPTAPLVDNQCDALWILAWAEENLG